MDQLGTFLPLALLAVAFYFLLIRPQQKRAKAQAELQSALEPGARVMTTAGVLGTVVSVTPDEIGIEVAPGVVIAHVPAAVSKVLEAGPQALPNDHDSH